MKIFPAILIALFLFTISERIHSQIQPAISDSIKNVILQGRIINGDTLPHIVLREVTIVPAWKFKNQREHFRYNRLVHNIKVALPYARVASDKLKDINSELGKIKGDKARRRYLREAEKALFAEFEAPLRKLTFSQGKMLIKLIDRETGDTSYELIQLYKGKVSAFFWQSIARIFGANLKEDYDPDRDDKMIEHIIIMIDNGMI